MIADPAKSNVEQDAGELIPAEWRVLCVAKSRPMDITIRAEDMGSMRSFWKYQGPPYNGVVEEAGGILDRALFNPRVNPPYWECAIAQPDGAVLANIYVDWPKRETAIKKVLGSIEYKPEFAVTDASGTEFCRIETLRGAGLLYYYRMDFGGMPYRLQQTSRTFWAWKARWSVRCGESCVAESTRVNWLGGIASSQMDLSLTASEHLPPVVLLLFTWWCDEEFKHLLPG